MADDAHYWLSSPESATGTPTVHLSTAPSLYGAEHDRPERADPEHGPRCSAGAGTELALPTSDSPPDETSRTDASPLRSNEVSPTPAGKGQRLGPLGFETAAPKHNDDQIPMASTQGTLRTPSPATQPPPPATPAPNRHADLARTKPSDYVLPAYDVNREPVEAGNHSRKRQRTASMIQLADDRDLGARPGQATPASAVYPTNATMCNTPRGEAQVVIDPLTGDKYIGNVLVERADGSRPDSLWRGVNGSAMCTEALTQAAPAPTFRDGQNMVMTVQPSPSAPWAPAVCAPNAPVPGSMQTATEPYGAANPHPLALNDGRGDLNSVRPPPDQDTFDYLWRFYQNAQRLENGGPLNPDLAAPPTLTHQSPAVYQNAYASHALPEPVERGSPRVCPPLPASLTPVALSAALAAPPSSGEPPNPTPRAQAPPAGRDLVMMDVDGPNFAHPPHVRDPPVPPLETYELAAASPVPAPPMTENAPSSTHTSHDKGKAKETKQLAERPTRAEALTRAGKLTVIPPPEGGYPVKHPMGPHDLIRGLDPQKIESWKEELEPRTWVVVEIEWQRDMRDRAHARLAKKLFLSHVSTILGRDDFLYVSPDPESNCERKGDFTTAWLLYGLTPEEWSMLLRQRVWPMLLMTLHIHGAFETVPEYLLSYGGFQQGNAAVIEREIKRIYAEKGRLPYLATIMTGATDRDPTEPELEAARKVLRTIKVKTYPTFVNGEEADYIAQVYCKPPTPDVYRWQEWRSSLFEFPIDCRFEATGKPLDPVRCVACHGGDHVYAQCPFAAIKGWAERLGPTPDPPKRAQSSAPNTGRPLGYSQTQGARQNTAPPPSYAPSRPPNSNPPPPQQQPQPQLQHPQQQARQQQSRTARRQNWPAQQTRNTSAPPQWGETGQHGIQINNPDQARYAGFRNSVPQNYRPNTYAGPSTWIEPKEENEGGPRLGLSEQGPAGESTSSGHDHGQPRGHAYRGRQLSSEPWHAGGPSEGDWHQ